MKFLHLADLHIGKRVNEFNMIEEQRHILHQIVDIASAELPQAVLIAGDIYDKTHPPVEAVELLDQFLTELTEITSVFIISGNHDSPERLGFGSHLLAKNGLYIAGTYQKDLYRIRLSDEHGPIFIHMLPFVKPALLKPFFNQAIPTYDEAVRLALSEATIDCSARNILLAHQFVTAHGEEPERSDSEMISVGGLDHIDVSAFDRFDYVALGHLHRAQQIASPHIRYAGSPLKYSFSEAHHQKSIVLGELGAKNELNVSLLPLTPLHDLRKIRGPIEELLRTGSENPYHATDYIHATLTDEEEIYDALGQMRKIYPNLMALDFDNSRNRTTAAASFSSEPAIRENPLALFDDFYKLQNNNPLNEEQRQLMQEIFIQSGEQMI